MINYKQKYLKYKYKYEKLIQIAGSYTEFINKYKDFENLEYPEDMLQQINKEIQVASEKKFLSFLNEQFNNNVTFSDNHKWLEEFNYEKNIIQNEAIGNCETISLAQIFKINCKNIREIISNYINFELLKTEIIIVIMSYYYKTKNRHFPNVEVFPNFIFIQEINNKMLNQKINLGSLEIDKISGFETFLNYASDDVGLNLLLFNSITNEEVENISKNIFNTNDNFKDIVKSIIIETDVLFLNKEMIKLFINNFSETKDFNIIEISLTPDTSLEQGFKDYYTGCIIRNFTNYNNIKEITKYYITLNNPSHNILHVDNFENYLGLREWRELPVKLKDSLFTGEYKVQVTIE